MSAGFRRRILYQCYVKCMRFSSVGVPSIGMGWGLVNLDDGKRYENDAMLITLASMPQSLLEMNDPELTINSRTMSLGPLEAFIH